MKPDKMIKTIKMICTRKYEIAIIEMHSGLYRVISEYGGEVHTSDPIHDFKTASFIFDTKVLEFEGH